MIINTILEIWRFLLLIFDEWTVILLKKLQKYLHSKNTACTFVSQSAVNKDCLISNPEKNETHYHSCSNFIHHSSFFC